MAPKTYLSSKSTPKNMTRFACYRLWMKLSVQTLGNIRQFNKISNEPTEYIKQTKEFTWWCTFHTNSSTIILKFRFRTIKKKIGCRVDRHFLWISYILIKHEVSKCVQFTRIIEKNRIQFSPIQTNKLPMTIQVFVVQQSRDQFEYTKTFWQDIHHTKFSRSKFGVTVVARCVRFRFYWCKFK